MDAMKASKVSALKELIRALLKKEGSAKLPEEEGLAVEVETDDPEIAGELMEGVKESMPEVETPEEEEDWRKDFSRSRKLPVTGKTRNIVAPNATSPKPKMMARR